MCEIFINGCLSSRYADKVSIGDDVLVQRNGTLIQIKLLVCQASKCKVNIVHVIVSLISYDFKIFLKF